MKIGKILGCTLGVFAAIVLMFSVFVVFPSYVPSAKELVLNELTRQDSVCDNAPKSVECKHLKDVELYKQQ